MYQSNLHAILVQSLVGTVWTRSTKDEDNFRQVICSSLYSHISPNNVEIPSTRSGHGDIKVFNRKIEIKYASNEKTEDLAGVIEDFELLLESKIEFVIVAIKLDTSAVDNFLHRCIHMPMLSAQNARADFGNKVLRGQNYKQISIFLPATYPHAPQAMTLRTGRGKNSTAYLSIERTFSISRSSFLDTGNGLIHVDVIGSKEDGLICFLYKRADGIELVDTQVPHTEIQIPYNPNPLVIGTSRIVNAEAKSMKRNGQQIAYSRIVETSVPCIDIRA